MQSSNGFSKQLGCHDCPPSLTTALDILHTACVPVVLVWGRDRAVFCNDAYAALCADQVQAIAAGQPLNDQMLVWSGGRSDVEQVMTTGQPLQRRHQPLIHSTPLASLPSARRHYSWSCSALRDEVGSVSGVLVVGGQTMPDLADIALRQSEERYRYLVEMIPQLVWTATTDGKLLEVNQRWLEFTGLTLAQARAEGWQAIVHPDDIPALTQYWSQAQQGGNYQAEGRIRRADGTYRWHLHQARPLENEQGEVIKWFGTATDIDDQKQLEQQREQLVEQSLRVLQQEQAAREAAERANRIKDEFLAVLSHELRSPLNPIIGWSKLLRSRKLDEQTAAKALETIERSARTQSQLIEDLLDVSRILQGKLKLNVGLVDLELTVQAAIETVQLAAEAKSIRMQTQIDPHLGHVSGDPNRLQQVVWNLLSNAIKFTPSGGQVEVTLKQIHTNAQIIIRDTGKGIDPNFLPHIFDYFRQEDSTSTRTFGGLGLGLAIVRHLVELHGGTIKADSLGLGQGSTFTLQLPTVQSQPQTLREGKQESQVIDLGGIYVLVVDDDDNTRELISFLLEQYGARVTAVCSAIDALAVISQTLPDLLLSDIGMPEINGYTLIRQLRALPPEQGGAIPAIALTAYAAEYDQQTALAAGFQLHLAKPIEPEELLSTIAQLVER